MYELLIWLAECERALAAAEQAMARLTRTRGASAAELAAMRSRVEQARSDVAALKLRLVAAGRAQDDAKSGRNGPIGGAGQPAVAQKPRLRKPGLP